MRNLFGNLFRNSCFFGLLIISTSVRSQTMTYLDSLETREQRCLDKGEDMLGCSEVRYAQADSILNHVYRGIRKRLNEAQRTVLKSEQLAWLKKRDQKYKADYAESSDDFAGPDLQMIVRHKQSVFVEERIVELIKKYGDVPLPNWAH